MSEMNIQSIFCQDHWPYHGNGNDNGNHMK